MGNDKHEVSQMRKTLRNDPFVSCRMCFLFHDKNARPKTGKSWKNLMVSIIRDFLK